MRNARGALLTAVQEMGRLVDVSSPNIDAVLGLVQQLPKSAFYYNEIRIAPGLAGSLAGIVIMASGFYGAAKVPDVSGMSLTQAKEALRGAEYLVAVAEQDVEDPVRAAGEIVSTRHGVEIGAAVEAYARARRPE